jgi:hypothetical protein
MRLPRRAFGTVVILSIIKRDAIDTPFLSVGSTIIRNNGASVGSVVNARSVMEFAACPFSCCPDVFGYGVYEPLVGLGKLAGSDRLRLLARGVDERSRAYIWHPYLDRPQSLRPQALTMRSDLVPRRADPVQHGASPNGYM